MSNNNNELYPLLFNQVCKEYLWGGNRLSAYGKTIPASGIFAESWELSCHPDGESIVANGPLTGTPLSELVAKYGTLLMGDKLACDKVAKFPILIKFIDAKNPLSVQVHPDDEFASANEGPNELGKTEMWYIIEAEPGAKLVCGLRPGTTREVFAKAVSEGRISECLGEIAVKPGDFINIPAGMVHAIGSGILLCEVQQNSNTTYRVYDYDRTDANGNKRELHIEKALGSIHFDKTNDVSSLVTGLPLPYEISKVHGTANRTILVANEFFAAEKIELDGTVTQTANGACFCSYTAINGNCSLVHNNKPYPLEKGTTIFIPASIGDYSIEGQCTLLKAFVPDIEENIINPLTTAGFSVAEIESNVAITR